MTYKRDILFTVMLCTGLAALVCLDTASYPTVQGQGFGQGPAFYPRLLAGALLLLGLLEGGNIFLHKSIDAAVRADDGDSPGKVRQRAALPLIVVSFTALFVMCMEWTGFILGGFLLVFGTSLVIQSSFSMRTVRVSLTAAAFILILVWLIFSFSIGVDLPAAKFLNI